MTQHDQPPPPAAAAHASEVASPPAATASEAKDANEAILDTLWSKVIEAWDDDKPHHALLEYALRAQKLPDVAGRYRAIKERDADKAARAQKKLDGIVIAATHMLMSMKSPPDKYKLPPVVSALIFGGTVLMLAWLAFLMLHRGR